MAKYRVTIKKVTEADIVIEADTAAQARSMAKEKASELFALSESFDRDVFTVGVVTKASVITT